MGLLALGLGLGWALMPWICLRGPLVAAQAARRWTLFNLAVPTACWVIACLSVPQKLPPSILLGLLGLGLPVLPLLAQFGVAHQLYRWDQGVMKQRFSRPDFMHQILSRIGVIVSPPGLALGILGAIGTLVVSWPDVQSVSLSLLVLFALVGLWTLMWNSLRELGVPGKMMPFPLDAWSDDLFRLAARMQAPLRTIFLSQTQQSRIAGAYSFGSGKVGLTDTLLAHLEHEEFLAVMAHELRHLTHARETVRLLIAGTISSTLVGLAAFQLQHLVPSALAGAVAFALMMFVAAFFLRRLVGIKQRHEDEADDAAVAFVGALPLMQALVKVYILNDIRRDRRTTRYRSLNGRLQRLAKLGRLPDESVERVVRRVHLQMGAEGRLDERMSPTSLSLASA